jgi:hypothetical protein
MTDINLNYTKRFSSYHVINTLRHHCRNSRFCSWFIAVVSENHTKHTNAPRKQNADLFFFKTNLGAHKVTAGLYWLRAFQKISASYLNTLILWRATILFIKYKQRATNSQKKNSNSIIDIPFRSFSSPWKTDSSSDFSDILFLSNNWQRNAVTK